MVCMCVCVSVAELLGMVINKESGTFIVEVDDQPPACHSARAAEHTEQGRASRGSDFVAGGIPTIWF